MKRLKRLGSGLFKILYDNVNVDIFNMTVWGVGLSGAVEF